MRRRARGAKEGGGGRLRALRKTWAATKGAGKATREERSPMTACSRVSRKGPKRRKSPPPPPRPNHMAEARAVAARRAKATPTRSMRLKRLSGGLAKTESQTWSSARRAAASEPSPKPSPAPVPPTGITRSVCEPILAITTRTDSGEGANDAVAFGGAEPGMAGEG